MNMARKIAIKRVFDMFDFEGFVKKIEGKTLPRF